MTPKQEARDRKRIRARLMRAGAILADLRELFETRADPYNEDDVPRYADWPGELDQLDSCLDVLDGSIGNFTVESD